MKRSFGLTAFTILLVLPPALEAQDPAPLGRFDGGLEVGYVVFSEGVGEDDGAYLGIAGYANVAPRIYLGLEVAAASSIGFFSDEMAIQPLELNVKYARALGSRFVADGGAGLSYSFAQFEEDVVAGPDVAHEDALFGGQIFADLVFRIGWFRLAAGAKYHLVQDFDDVPADFDNLRLGVRLGASF
jgi:hypothetical protein